MLARIEIAPAYLTNRIILVFYGSSDSVSEKEISCLLVTVYINGSYD